MKTTLFSALKAGGGIGSIGSMKLSISLPKTVAAEIRSLAKKSDRSVSWWVQRAWIVARTQLMNPRENEKAERSAMANLRSLEGSLKDSYPSISSVDLAHRAFQPKK